MQTCSHLLGLLKCCQFDPEAYYFVLLSEHHDVTEEDNWRFNHVALALGNALSVNYYQVCQLRFAVFFF